MYSDLLTIRYVELIWKLFKLSCLNAFFYNSNDNQIGRYDILYPQFPIQIMLVPAQVKTMDYFVQRGSNCICYGIC